MSRQAVSLPSRGRPRREEKAAKVRGGGRGGGASQEGSGQRGVAYGCVPKNQMMECGEKGTCTE